MAAANNNTMVKIQTVTVGSGGASSIEFTSIPQTYTDLVLVLSGRTANSATYSYNDIYFNNTNANTGIFVYGDPSYATGGATTIDFIQNGNTATASTFGSTYFYIPNYRSSTNKSFMMDNVMEGNYSSIQLQIASYYSTVTSAITAIKLVNTASSNWVQYSTATLYGVSAVGSGTTLPKATGGVITSDTSYIYHTFLGTGTFVPSSTISCEYLAIAGGAGGGSAYIAGGGGAGGLVYNTASFSSGVTYTMTIGGGGNGNTAGGGQGRGYSGSDTTITGSGFSTVTATGGGGGGSNQASDKNGANGGSGGGAGNGGTAGTGSQGNNGGAYQYNSGTNTGGGGGGGGAGAAGSSGNSTTNVGGDGGAGSSSYSAWGVATYTGQTVAGTYYYAGGGGAGGIGLGGAGGNGGGGKGSGPYDPPIAGTANTGGGGGGNGGYGSLASAAGGSGVVIIRYAK